ncbi:MAG TPA: fatty acid desaturase [Phycisphaerales bacterium]|nr:fatty acid desaturase [Phycisphaerales bacterium]
MSASSRWRRLATLRWHNILMIVVAHALAVVALFHFEWSALFVCAILYFWTACLGLTLGWHRLLSHGSFKAHPAVRYFLAASGSLALQNGPIEWVGVHRVHHAHTDEEEDPHTPLVQIAWAHIGWIFAPLPFDPRDFARDLERDRGIRIIDRCHWLFSIALAVALYAAGEWWNQVGVAWVLWGMAVRTVLVFHATWFVNSAAHTWGYRNFETNDNSRNLWWVAVLTFGEGWHNNHHAAHRCAAHGIRWWEFDLTYAIVRALERVGLATQVVHPPRTADMPTEPVKAPAIGR